MPFITQGKANIKYLLIVALVATVAGGVIFYTWDCYQKETSNASEGEKTQNKELTLDQIEKVDFNIYNPDAKEYPALSIYLTGNENYYKNSVIWTNLNNDNKRDALVVLAQGSGGSAVGILLGAIINENDSPKFIGYKNLGDRTQIRNITFENGVIIVDMFVKGPNDSGCCPSVEKIAKYKFSDNQLLEVNETADWKTYRNDKYGFEIKYPSNYKVSTDTQTNIGPALRSDSYSQVIFRIFTYTRSQIDLEKSKAEKLIIGSFDSYRYPVMGNMDGGIDSSVSFYDYPNTNNVFNILFSTAKPGEEDEISVFNKILSTLKFDLKSDTSIKTGEIKIDYQALQTLQDSVNQGHQPWRLDPESVVRAETIQYGFIQADLSSLKLTSQAASAAINDYEIIHNGKVYIIRAIQAGQIWTLSSIKLK